MLIEVLPTMWSAIVGVLAIAFQKYIIHVRSHMNMKSDKIQRILLQLKAKIAT
jgi:hypothetical protein